MVGLASHQKRVLFNGAYCGTKRRMAQKVKRWDGEFYDEAFCPYTQCKGCGAFSKTLQNVATLHFPPQSMARWSSWFIIFLRENVVFTGRR